MTYEVQQTRWDRLIRRVSGSIGPGSRVSETLSELFPVIDVERVPGELLLLGGTRLGTASFPITAGVGDFPGAQLENPAGSGTLITVTLVILSAQAAGSFLWSTTEGQLATALPTASRLRDTRQVFPAQPTGLLRIQTDLAAPVDSQGQVLNLSGTKFDLEAENGLAILAPGERFTVGHNIAATFMTATFFWRERAAEESELQF
ncbi:hypothetical protein LCGC14_2491050 [marine sediment metagenome]|uniref:Uncharacterized protein n=1 Tax=marine sediment metagenome TaxID=412755 RepID=A0A0F9B5E7_9ZZZZ